MKLIKIYKPGNQYPESEYTVLHFYSTNDELDVGKGNGVRVFHISAIGPQVTIYFLNKESKTYFGMMYETWELFPNRDVSPENGNSESGASIIPPVEGPDIYPNCVPPPAAPGDNEQTNSQEPPFWIKTAENPPSEDGYYWGKFGDVEKILWYIKDANEWLKSNLGQGWITCEAPVLYRKEK